MTNTQRLPARPSDFRINLAEQEKSIVDSKLSGILTYMVRQGLLQHKRGKFPYPKGAPLSDIKQSGIAEERRGSGSHYTMSKAKELINQVLIDPEFIQLIDNAILNSSMFYRFSKYCFEAYLYQMKENEQAFLKTMSPVISKYGLAHKRLEELDSSYIFAKDLTADKIDRLSKGYANNTINSFKKDGKNILITVAGLFFLFNVYDSEKGEKQSKT